MRANFGAPLAIIYGMEYRMCDTCIFTRIPAGAVACPLCGTLIYADGCDPEPALDLDEVGAGD